MRWLRALERWICGSSWEDPAMTHQTPVQKFTGYDFERAIAGKRESERRARIARSLHAKAARPEGTVVDIQTRRAR